MLAQGSSAPLTSPDVLAMYRFEPADWPIAQSSDDKASLKSLNAAIDDFWTVFEKRYHDDEVYLELAPTASEVVLRAIGEGLLRARTQLDWSPVGSPERLAIFVWVHDPDDPQIVREIAQTLNDPATFAEFSSRH